MRRKALSKTLRVTDEGIAGSGSDTPQVYPNPASDTLYIKSAEPVRAVRLVSALGQEVEAALSAGRMDISHLPSGLYYMTVPPPSSTMQHRVVVR